MDSQRRASPLLFSCHGASLSGRRTRGVTLIEILVVLTLLVLMSGISAFVFQTMRKNYALSASVAGVQGLIVGARHAAMTSGVPVRVVIDPGQRVAQSFKFETLGEWSFDEFDEHDTETYGISYEPA